MTRLLEIIGEAASRVPPESQSRFRELPWNEMVGMRNRIIHGYDTVDYDRVWSTVPDDLPALIQLLEKALGDGRE